jgi:hypothetical protein
MSNPTAMLAGVGLLSLCCISSSLLAGAMGGGGETPEEGGGGGAGATTPSLPKGQYVRLEHTVAHDANAEGNDDDKHKIINLAELEVFAKDGTTSLAASKTVEAANFHPAGPLPNLTDGNFSNFAHTLGRDVNEIDKMTVDLGSENEIEKIKITNRVDCCKHRAQGIKAVILAADGTTVVKETPAITTTADTYTFTFPESTTWA